LLDAARGRFREPGILGGCSAPCRMPPIPPSALAGITRWPGLPLCRCVPS